MFTDRQSNNREKFNIKLKSLSVCLIFIGIISNFAFIGLHPILSTYAQRITTIPLPTTNASVVVVPTFNTGNISSRNCTTAAAVSSFINEKGQIVPIHPSTIESSQTSPGLPCGIWNLISNGVTGGLLIGSLDNQGKITGSIFGHALNGTWDPISQKINFTTTIGSGASNSITYEYSGFYHNICGIHGGEIGNQPSCTMLSGSAIPKGPHSGQAPKQDFGWIAFWNLCTRC